MQTKGVGTVGYIAPEVLLGGQDVTYDGSKADILSAGAAFHIFWEYARNTRCGNFASKVNGCLAGRLSEKFAGVVEASAS